VVRWAAFAGVVSVLLTLLLASTRISAAVARDETPPTGRPDDPVGDEAADDQTVDETTRVRDVFESDGLLSPLPWRDDEPADPLSGSGGTELTTLDESDYPDPPPDHARPDEPDDSTGQTETDAVLDPSDAFPISGEAEYTDSELPADDRSPATDDPSDRASDRLAHDDTAPGNSTADRSLPDASPGPDGEPSGRTGRGDTSAGHDRWTERDAAPEDRWRGRPPDSPDTDGVDDATVATDVTAADDAGPDTTDTAVAADDAAVAADDAATPGVATARGEPGPGLTPDAFDGTDPFAGETDGFDPRLPSERDSVRVGDRELSTTVVLANVVGSQLLFAGLLVAVTVWAAVPVTALGLGSVTLSQVGVGALLGAGLWVVSESGGRLSRRMGVDPAEALRGALAPTTRREWWLLLGVVLPVVAVFEELLFRAALIGAFAAGASATGLNLPVAALVVGSSVAFGLAHSTQGRVGMVVTGLFGVVLATAFVLTDSLVVVVVAHYVVNAAEFVVHEGPVGQFPAE